MRPVLALIGGLLARVGRSRQDLLLENVARRHPLMLCERRPRVTEGDRLRWAPLRRRWAGGRPSLVILHPDTVGRWHRTGWRRCWTWKRRPPRPGRRRIPVEARDLILRRARENPRWGAVRIRAARRPPGAADHPPQPARRPLGGGLLPRPDAHGRDGVRLLPHRACAAPHRVRHRHGPSHGGLDLAAADRGHSLAPSPALSDPRPRPRCWEASSIATNGPLPDDPYCVARQADDAAELSKLLIRLHEQTSDPALRKRILNAIDEMVRAGFYGLDDQLQRQFDR